MKTPRLGPLAVLLLPAVSGVSTVQQSASPTSSSTVQHSITAPPSIAQPSTPPASVTMLSVSAFDSRGNGVRGNFDYCLRSKDPIDDKTRRYCYDWAVKAVWITHEHFFTGNDLVAWCREHPEDPHYCSFPRPNDVLLCESNINYCIQGEDHLNNPHIKCEEYPGNARKCTYHPMYARLCRETGDPVYCSQIYFKRSPTIDPREVEYEHLEDPHKLCKENPGSPRFCSYSPMNDRLCRSTGDPIYCSQIWSKEHKSRMIQAIKPPDGPELPAKCKERPEDETRNWYYKSILNIGCCEKRGIDVCCENCWVMTRTKPAGPIGTRNFDNEDASAMYARICKETGNEDDCKNAEFQNTQTTCEDHPGDARYCSYSPMMARLCKETGSPGYCSHIWSKRTGVFLELIEGSSVSASSGASPATLSVSSLSTVSGPLAQQSSGSPFSPADYSSAELIFFPLGTIKIKYEDPTLEEELEVYAGMLAYLFGGNPNEMLEGPKNISDEIGSLDFQNKTLTAELVMFLGGTIRIKYKDPALKGKLDQFAALLQFVEGISLSEVLEGPTHNSSFSITAPTSSSLARRTEEKPGITQMPTASATHVDMGPVEEHASGRVAPSLWRSRHKKPHLTPSSIVTPVQQSVSAIEERGSGDHISIESASPVPEARPPPNITLPFNGTLNGTTNPANPNYPVPFDSPVLSKIRTFAALGDSYASGFGAGEQLDQECGRYDHAYGNLIDSDPRLGDRNITGRTFQFLACTGAKITDIIDKQLTKLEKPIDAMTITVGGNDLGFTSFVEDCVYAEEPDTYCDFALSQTTKYLNLAFPIPLDILLKSAKSALTPDTGRIYITGYPTLFNDRTEQCNIMSYPFPEMLITQELRELFNGLVRETNGLIMAAAERAGHQVIFVDIDSWFFGCGGRICDSGMDLPNKNQGELLIFEERGIDSSISAEAAGPKQTDEFLPGQFSRAFHPRSNGHRLIADVIISHMSRDLPGNDNISVTCPGLTVNSKNSSAAGMNENLVWAVIVISCFSAVSSLL